MTAPLCQHGNPLRDEPHGQPLTPSCGCLALPWPDPTPAQLEDPVFKAIWQVIYGWDIHVPGVDGPGLYTTATGNHVRAIMERLPKVHEQRVQQTLGALAEVLTNSINGSLPHDELVAVLRRILCV